MQIRVFSIPITDGGSMQEEMNKFLRGHKVLAVQQELVTNATGSYWCFYFSENWAAILLNFP